MWGVGGFHHAPGEAAADRVRTPPGSAGGGGGRIRDGESYEKVTNSEAIQPSRPDWSVSVTLIHW